MDRLVGGPVSGISEPSARADQFLEEMLHLLERSDAPDSIGRLAGLEVHSMVDAGAMGSVWKAWDPSLNRAVAVKFLAPVLAANKQARHRFVREARAAGAIRHPNVVPIFSTGEIKGLPYLVMEFVPGESLARRLDRGGPLAASEVLEIGRQIAAGLAAAHAQGIVHRDIKPGNILVDQEINRVKITDFGLARVADERGLTRSGCVAGTPEYLSPEQASGALVDHRADLFSLGCVLYALCTGTSPFHAESIFAVVRKVCDHHPTPLRVLNPEFPEAFGDLVNRLLEKDPDRRIQSAAEVEARLNACPEAMGKSIPFQSSNPMGESRGMVPCVRRTHGIRLRWIAFSVAFILILSVTAMTLLWREGESAPEPSSPPIPSPTASNPTPGTVVVRNTVGEEMSVPIDLAEGIRTAEAGAVIECRWNGEWATDGLDAEDKPLTLRAAPGFRPVLVITRRPGPLLRSRGRMQMEGLTFKIPVMESKPSEASYHSVFGEAVIEVIGAPLFMANCRLEMQMPTGGPVGPICVIGLKGPKTAVFENCEFYSPHIGTIVYFPASPDGPGDDRLVVRNCVQTGFALVHLKQTAQEPPSVELTGNTTALGYVIGFTDPPAGGPVTIEASRNVFDLLKVVNTAPQSRRNTPESLLRWVDRTNVLQVKEGFTLTQPALKILDEWHRFAGVEGQSGVSLQLNLAHRIQELRKNPARHAPERFLLSDAEMEALNGHRPGLAAQLGVNPEICGPGPAYEAWAASPAYAAWR